MSYLIHSVGIKLTSLCFQVPIHASGTDARQTVEELQQLREIVATLTAQCAELDEANRAWQLYHQTQADTFRTKLQEHLPIDESVSFDQIPEVIVNQLNKEREDFTRQYLALEKVNDDLRADDTAESIQESYTNTVNNLNQELLALREAYDQVNSEKQALTNELEQRVALGNDQEPTRQTIGMFIPFYIS